MKREKALELSIIKKDQMIRKSKLDPENRDVRH
jgi:hypothetical protein